MRLILQRVGSPPPGARPRYLRCYGASQTVGVYPWCTDETLDMARPKLEALIARLEQDPQSWPEGLTAEQVADLVTDLRCLASRGVAARVLDNAQARRPTAGLEEA